MSILNTYQERLLRQLRLEFGPDVLQALEDPTVVEILLNPDGSLWAEKHGDMRGHPLKEAGK